jgi:hypothetical protein
MKVLDPGHFYLLNELDYNDRKESLLTLQFVKREGPKYPGNVGHYSGTTLQEVLRACCDRLRYVYKQVPAVEDLLALDHLKEALWQLETRAAKRHGRCADMSLDEAEFGPCCPKCNHVGCKGECH